MEGLRTFLAMGGYAGFVWSAYGLTALVVGVLAYASWRSARRAERRLSALTRARDASGPSRAEDEA